MNGMAVNRTIMTIINWNCMVRSMYGTFYPAKCLASCMLLWKRLRATTGFGSNGMPSMSLKSTIMTSSQKCAASSMYGTF